MEEKAIYRDSWINHVCAYTFSRMHHILIFTQSNGKAFNSVI